MSYKIHLAAPDQGKTDLIYTRKALVENSIGPYGEYVTRLKEQFQNYLGCKTYDGDCFVMKSGTSAIHLSLILLDVKENDIVLCQTSTFIASVNPILYQNAVPVFIDSEKETWNMCPELLENAIEEYLLLGIKPKAILVGCSYGMPCNYKKIMALSVKHNIPLIEDAAAALGSVYHNLPCGSFGEFSIFSLNANKIITGSSGGILCSNEHNVSVRVADLISQSKDSLDVGYNYQLSNICAAIASSQFEELDHRISRKREIYDNYTKQLSKFENLTFLEEPKNCFSNRWLTTMLFDSNEERDLIIDQLATHQIETRKLWQPLHRKEKFRKYKVYLNGVSDELYNKGICLPSGVGLSELEQNTIIGIIKSNI